MINPELQPFLDDWARHWADLPQPAGPARRRAHFEQVAQRMRQPTPEGIRTDEEFYIAVPGSGRSVRVRVFRPAGDARRAALVYLHGGAWMQGSPETHWDITARLAAANDLVVISVDYALAPEQPFPAAVNDVATVVRWAFAAGADLLNLNRAAIAVGGDSAGANLAAAQTLLFRDSGIRLKAQWLVYPGVDFRTDRPSHIENAHGPIVSVATMPAVNAAYCPKLEDQRNPLAAPLLAESHAGLPPAFIAVAQHDPLRDEGRAYAQALRDAGVAVELDEGEGLIHGYLRALAYCADTRLAFDRMCLWLRQALAT
jgi:acetyl esterase